MDQEKAKALFFEGIAHFDAADFAGAEAKLRAALAIVPDRPSALTNLAAALFHQDKLAEAASVAERATVVDPSSVEAWVALASALTKLRRPDDALAAAERAVAVAPANPTALMSRASALRELHLYDRAIADYEAARRVSPHEKDLLGLLVAARMHGCEWRGLTEETAALIAGLRDGSESVNPFSLLAMPSVTAADQLRCAIDTIARQYPPKPALYRGEPYSHDRIRVAYVSGDYRRHPLAYLMAGVFEQHDRRRYETFGVSFGVDDGSEIRQRVLGAFDNVLDVREQSDEDVAALLHDNKIDIAVDLGGLTSGGRPNIFARRPAPIQAAYLGFPGTSGMPYIDYLIADRTVVHEAERRFYSEQVVWLPDTYYPFDNRLAIASEAPSRAIAGLPERGFVFCSFNNAYKIAPEMFGVWAGLLRDVPGSVLWLLESSATAAANLRGEAAASGIAPDRMVFAPPVSTDQHLARHRLADLFLDTLPYNAHTTATDALWTGLPLVTCAGDTFPSRVAASLLKALGVPELITASLAEYAALVLRLAREPAALAAIRTKLTERRTTAPLFDTARFTRHLEAAFTEMFERHRRGEPPAHFQVEPIAG